MVTQLFSGHSTTALVLAKGSAHPLGALNGLHHNVLASLYAARRSVTLRHFSWEDRDAHLYQDCRRP